MLIQPFLNALSPAGAHARLTVLIFHRVLEVPDPLLPGEPDSSRFRAQMQWLKSSFNVLSLPDAVDRLRAGSLPKRAAAVTFDDGYADNFTVALPILQEAEVPATFFIASGYLDGGRMWNDTMAEVIRRAQGPEIELQRFGLGRLPLGTIGERRSSLNQLLGKLKYVEPEARTDLVSRIGDDAGIAPSPDLMMTSAQVKDLASAGMTIGAHTVTHPILSRLAERAARAEMAQGREQLEGIIGGKVTLFAYPNGKPNSDYTEAHVRLAREIGFTAAFSTEWGAATTGSDLFQIPRFTPWDRSRWRYEVRLARNLRHRARGCCSSSTNSPSISPTPQRH
jgi:peptidoglycan/xylan/chitin deacetylase (PgdA/CDA1 family)